MGAIRINEKYFNTKKDAKDYYRLILEQHEEGQPISDNYKLDVLYLFSHHPKAAEKAPLPIIDIVCAIHPVHETKCFAIFGGDDNEAKVGFFSIKSCVTNYNHHKKIKREKSIRINREGFVYPLFLTEFDFS